MRANCDELRNRSTCWPKRVSKHVARYVVAPTMQETATPSKPLPRQRTAQSTGTVLPLRLRF